MKRKNKNKTEFIKKPTSTPSDRHVLRSRRSLPLKKYLMMPFFYYLANYYVLSLNFNRIRGFLCAFTNPNLYSLCQSTKQRHFYSTFRP